MGKQIIKVFQDYDGVLETGDLEKAADQLVRARMCGTEVRVGFNFLQRLLNEVLDVRRADAELYEEVEELWKQILAEPSDRLPEVPSGVFERTKERLFEEMGWTESTWDDAEAAAKATRIPSEELTSSEQVKMSEDTDDMIQIFDPGHPPAVPPELLVDTGEEDEEIDLRKKLPPPYAGRRKPLKVYTSYRSKRWHDDTTTRTAIIIVLSFLCFAIWGFLFLQG